VGNGAEIFKGVARLKPNTGKKYSARSDWGGTKLLLIAFMWRARSPELSRSRRNYDDGAGAREEFT